MYKQNLDVINRILSVSLVLNPDRIHAPASSKMSLGDLP